MSKVTDAKKRKSAPEPTVAAKKTKISKTEVEAPKTKPALKKTASRTIVKGDSDAVSVKQTKKPRAKAEDLIDQENEKPQVEKIKQTKKATPVKKAEDAAPKVSEVKEKKSPVAKPALKSAKAASKPAKAAPKAKAAPAYDSDDSDAEEEEDDKIDDQTAALLAGFESDEDENDPQDDDEKGIDVSKLPTLPNEKETKKALLAAQTTDDENNPGTIYIGRVPHGFFEHQMRAYFSQFGDITHLRLSRNKLTGRSKHYAFIEFSSAAVAEIVAKTMDKYLMFGHILQVRRIPDEQVHPNLWKGEGKRFKVMPRNKIEGSLLRRGKTRDKWAGAVKRETRSRKQKADKLKEMGYEFEMPELKKVGDVPVQTKEVDEKLTITAEEADEGDATVAKAVKETPEETVTKTVTEKADGEVKIETATAVKRTKGAKQAKKPVKKARIST
ncbi:hypothetical protein MBLNU457_g0455t1 [Dothideomycetes sp. NU457]